MRTEYGKLMFILQDSVSQVISEEIGFCPVTKIKTVASFLEEKNCVKLLEDKRLDIATKAILNFTVEGRKKKGEEIEDEKKAKREAIRQLCQEYKSSVDYLFPLCFSRLPSFESEKLSEQEIDHVLLSIGDNNSFLASNRDPVDSMILLLQKHFKEDEYDQETDLSIRYGVGGARLSHSHSIQYNYVYQSLVLWREISDEMFKLWSCADGDLLDSNCSYILRDTGQGLNRMQSAPRVGKVMSNILQRAYSKVGGSWIGSSAVHLGDISLSFLISIFPFLISQFALTKTFQTQWFSSTSILKFRES